MSEHLTEAHTVPVSCCVSVTGPSQQPADEHWWKQNQAKPGQR